MDGYRIFDVEIHTLTPLHIGTGRELLAEYDFVTRSSETLRLNEDAILDAQQVDDPEMARRLASITPGQLLHDISGTGSADGRFFRYTAKGVPRARGTGAQLREQIKTPFDELYIPGSSLKGAIRTALAWKLWKQRGMTPAVGRLRRSDRFAAADLEKDLFGPDPNHDLLRAVQVGDSAPAGREGLVIANVRVLTRGGLGEKGAPIELEAITSERKFATRIKVDTGLFEPWAQKAGLAADARELLEVLPAVLQAHAVERIAREIQWFAPVQDAGAIVGWYRELAALNLGKRRCLVQLGFGTGWDSKTLGSRLRADPRFMARILDDYRMTLGVKVAPERFPASRRVVAAIQRDPGGRTIERPISPLGWCLLTFKERT
jgi:CRISPR-associated protein Csm5